MDFEVLNQIPQCKTLLEIDSPITFREVNKAINKLNVGKSPGLIGILPEGLKAMGKGMRRRVHQYVADFFDGTQDYEGWHRSQCVPVPKKGNLSDPNKWRGVMLMDVASKVFSSVMNDQAFQLLELHGTQLQFGGSPEIGCRNGLFTLKALLNTRRNHNLPSFVGFVDLVKAYDTANHELLVRLLEKYGAPPKFVAAVRTMHTNNEVVLKIEKEIEEFMQGVGVCQADNMAPVLFPFLMTAFAETLEIEWRKQNIKECTVMTLGDEHIGHGQLSSHTPKMFSSKLLMVYSSFQCLYVDNGAFPFDSRKSLTKGMNLVFHHFAKFDLKMHIGRNGGESKTEFVFFPPPQFFCKRPLPSIDDNR